MTTGGTYWHCFLTNLSCYDKNRARTYLKPKISTKISHVYTFSSFSVICPALPLAILNQVETSKVAQNGTCV